MSERIACDVVVLGLGPGGQELATELAEAGLDTVGVEMHLVGGECPFYGCTPSKLMIRAADHVAMVHRADHLAGPATVEPDWSRPAARITDEATKGWTDDANAKAVQEAGVRLVRGHGRLVAPGVVEVEGVEYEASRGVVLNTGTEPLVLPIDGLADTPYWTNRDVVQVTELPRSLVVLGGGPIGCELAQAIARFGVAVTVIESDDRLLAVEEPESSELVTRLFEAEGIAVHTGVQVDRVEHDGTFVLTAGDLRVEAERLLVAAGRSNNIRDVGLENVGLDPDAKTVETDERMRAGDKLWAIGDITGHGRFTHVSTYQAEVAKADILGEDGPVADYRAVSRVTFTDPEIGSVGLTEEQAREQGLDVRTGFADVSGSARGWLDGEGNEGHIKLVADAGTGLLVGATTMGRTGGDLVAMLALAIHAKVPPSVVRRMHFAFPTYHGSVMTALDDLGL
ncbi:pyridine nucleotide-disulfide oxidoreductase [Nocardioides sp. Soil777]|uniref:dihydrolipoyl dehydrogenase family protein n=1 Tax=Nocardioides sp. Soil777 TaxID=1736409 RepID=UPI0007034021|nr:NAD(P)/FAD-dependent oxidoreductase [Nocardioides sp. Soil777]KRE98106.1 pyridine nucleotide-disulfide oxidoreductase [Nocardioides sp. Soil777]